MNPAAARRRRICTSFAGIVLMVSGGCAPMLGTPGRIARPAGAILSLDPNANWTQCVNDLIRIGPASVDWLMRRRCMQRPAPPDDLTVLMHVSLVRLLLPAGRGPAPTITALQVRHGLVYFEIRVRGLSVGEAIWPAKPPETWPALLVRGFRPALADQSDLEHDRRQLVAWWREHRATPAELVRREEYRPRTMKLWRLLAWHPADRWSPAGPAGELCAGDDGLSLTLPLARADYNLVRSACIWLGSRAEASVQRRLIDLVGSDLPVLRHNALFALGFSPHAGVRKLLKQHRGQPDPEPRETGLWVRRSGPTGRMPPRRSLEATTGRSGCLPQPGTDEKRVREGARNRGLLRDRFSASGPWPAAPTDPSGPGLDRTKQKPYNQGRSVGRRGRATNATRLGRPGWPRNRTPGTACRALVSTVRARGAEHKEVARGRQRMGAGGPHRTAAAARDPQDPERLALARPRRADRPGRLSRGASRIADSSPATNARISSALASA